MPLCKCIGQPSDLLATKADQSSVASDRSTLKWFSIISTASAA